jgi:hypothetical protein
MEAAAAMRPVRSHRRRPQGQALVILVMSIIPALLMCGLIIDGGNAWAKQRETQNAADAGADAGATILAKRDGKSQACTTDVCWDGKVKAAVTDAGNDKGVTMLFCGSNPPDLTTSQCTYYTDFNGAALGLVGNGVIPLTTAGVRAIGTKQFNTYFARIAGINTYTAGADATARYGYLGGCESSQGNQIKNCLPISFYINWSSCDKSGKTVVQAPATDITSYLNQDLALPICKGTGNWGWLNPSDINNPIPGWFSSDTGRRSNMTAAIQALVVPGCTGADCNTIMIPIYDCANSTASLPASCTDPDNATRLSGYSNCTGSNCYYHIVKLGAFQLKAFYTGNPICQGFEGQNSTDCLYGQFTAFVSDGLITQSPTTAGTGGGARGVQLIK